ncbi:hypothetical protein WJM97_03460 [Okeanomitos corallinicola TIOX110]|uniref:Uncharacterized protein n=1 Tax=Okeanomitos corallinicola TIOX110 TaxID=3133117 RepID=A0ABZ2UUH2_9CYAN
MSRDKQRKTRNKSRDKPQNSLSPKPDQKNQSLWKTTIIQFLRGTIGFLENTVVKLETEQSATTEKKPNLLERILLGWDKFLQTFRLFLPSQVSNNVSDTVLTLIFAVFAVVLVVLTTFLFTSKPTEVAIIPPVEEVITPEAIPTSTPEPEPIPTSTPEPEPIPTSTPEPEPIPTSTPEPEPIPTLIPEPEPIPTSVELTPEQNLIAAIKNQLAEIAVVTIQNKEGENITVNLIKSIQANLHTSDLIITIRDDWYRLEKSAQKKLAGDILQRSQELDFTHLQIIDSQDKLIARSPVVGNEMIIFIKHSGFSTQQL